MAHLLDDEGRAEVCAAVQPEAPGLAGEPGELDVYGLGCHGEAGLLTAQAGHCLLTTLLHTPALPAPAQSQLSSTGSARPAAVVFTGWILPAAAPPCPAPAWFRYNSVCDPELSDHNCHDFLYLTTYLSL